MAGPIKPSDVTKRKSTSVPEEVFEAFNELITEKFNGRFATVKLKQVADLALQKLRASGKEEYQSLSRQEMYDRGWMDVEGVYEKAGWKVEFDKPGYCETYDAFFKFQRK